MVPKYQLIIALCFIGGSLNKKVQKVGKIEPLYLLQEYQQSIFTELFENIWLEISPSFFVPLSECPFAIAKTHSSVLCDIMLSSSAHGFESDDNNDHGDKGGEAVDGDIDNTD